MARDYEIDVWDKEAEREWQNDPHTLDFSPKVENLLKRYLPKNAVVLDAGCSIGKHVHAFQKLGCQVIAIEQSKVAVEYFKKTYPDVLIANMRIQEMDLHNTIDLIFTSGVLQHSIEEKQFNILNLFHEALKPEGYYFFTENTLPPQTPTDGYSHTFDEWKALLEKANFTLNTFLCVGPYYLFKVIK